MTFGKTTRISAETRTTAGQSRVSVTAQSRRLSPARRAWCGSALNGRTGGRASAASLAGSRALTPTAVCSGTAETGMSARGRGAPSGAGNPVRTATEERRRSLPPLVSVC